GFTPTPPQSGFHIRSAAFGFHTHTTVVKVSHPLHCIWVSHPHTGFDTHTAAVRVSHPLRCIRVSHPGFHTHTQGFTPTPPQSGFHTRSAAFGFHT
ncbi:hypothetical protein CRG98_048056, partial [Punica granatum]